MKKNIFILMIVIEEMFIGYISVSRVGWNFITDIILPILMINIGITIIFFYLLKRDLINKKNVKHKLLIIILTIIIIFKLIIIVNELIYTNNLVIDVKNMYSSQFMQNVNSYEELINTLNITEEEKNILNDNNDYTFSSWAKKEKKKPLNIILTKTPLIEREHVKAIRMVHMSCLQEQKQYGKSFEKYKKEYSNISSNENPFVLQANELKNNYILHLIIFFIISTLFEMVWLLLIINLRKKD